MRIVDEDDDVLREGRIVAPRDLLDLGERCVVAAHREDAVGDDERAAAAGGGDRRELAVEIGDVVMAIDPFLLRPRETDRVDDAVVVELVRDDRGLRGHQRREDTDHRRVGRRKDQRRLAAMERGEPRLERDVRRVGAADEAHRTRARAEPPRRGFFRRHHLEAQVHAEVVVGVHLQVAALAAAGEAVARSEALRGRHHVDDDPLVPFRIAPRVEGLELASESDQKAVVGHGVLSRLGA